MSRTVRAAGGVLWREQDGQVLVAVVHRPRYDDWSLPKGKLDDGEPAVCAAVREVSEETGFGCVVGRWLGESRYRVLHEGRDVPKTVQWWALRATGGDFTSGPEVDQLCWLTVRDAARRVSGHDDGVLARFAAAPPETSTVLLVRHGRAGDRAAWTGPDLERPLDADGRAQAAALAGVLPLWDPQAVLSAPALRCRQTVQPLAERLGLEVVVEPDLAEQAAPALPGLLRRLGAEGRSVVACGQGGAIPAAVQELTTEAGIAVEDVRARKGSVWALSFAGGRLVDAHATQDPRG